MNVYTYKGTAVALVEPPIKKGGEGAIYQVVGRPDKLVKLYTHDAEKRREKIFVMARLRQTPQFQKAGIDRQIAWPLLPLFDKDGKFLGFGMNKVPGDRGLDGLCAYPPGPGGGGSTQNRIDCLISMCDVIDRLHSVGQVCGDLNGDNVKVDKNWTAWFVDADSFHIRSAKKEYRCIVCGAGFVAPEILKNCKGASYADYPGQTFTPESDRFALAVHIFYILFRCHPYLCRRNVQNSFPAPSTDQRVERGETPFFNIVPGHTVPRFAPDVDAFPPYLRELFHRAFVDGHVDPGCRPSAAQWKRGLEKYKAELKQCRVDHDHAYWKGSKTCPYCAADKRYRQQMATSLARSAMPAPLPSGLGPGLGPALGQKLIAMQAAAVVKSQKAKQPWAFPAMTGQMWIFWAVTLCLAALVLAPLITSVLPRIYFSIAHDATVVKVGTVGSCISGVVGTLLYNLLWAPGRPRGWYRWYEYLLSVLAAPVFAFGFGVALGAVALALFLACWVICLGLFFAMIIAFCDT